MNVKQLSVRLHGEQVGILVQTETGKMEFAYANNAIKPISIGMPIREEPYTHVQCEAFFGGLLPESETAKKAIGKWYGVSYNNSFSLLKAIGYDCAGAISFHQMDEPQMKHDFFPLEGEIISEQDLYQHIQFLPQRPLFLGLEGLRLSLAGVQNKAAVCLINNQITFPKNGCPTTHILKPAIPGFEGSIENEYYCLEMAAQMGFVVPKTQIRRIKDISYLLIERYDREIQQNHVARIHQEDFCQALGIIAAKKYQNEGGPGFKACFDLLRKTTQPAVDRNKLAAIMVFNFLMGNMDAHGKNFSLLHKSQTQISVTPFYDLLCTRIYPSLTAKMAMKIGSKYQADEVLQRHWEQLCLDINYAFPALKKLLIHQGETILKIIDEKRDFFLEITNNAAVIEKINLSLKENIPKVLHKFGV